MPGAPAGFKLEGTSAGGLSRWKQLRKITAFLLPAAFRTNPSLRPYSQLPLGRTIDE